VFYAFWPLFDGSHHHGENLIMTTKHTPGPWLISERVKTARLDNALMVRPVYHQNYEYGATAIIATSEANARLIAAAPDLLAVLQQMIEVFLDTDGSFGADETEIMEMARAAIAKATGEKI
jgi:hypothetical protein